MVMPVVMVVAACAPLGEAVARRRSAAGAAHPRRHLVHAGAVLQVGHHEWTPAARGAYVGGHLLQVHLDVGRQVDLVDHQQVAAGNPEAALARDVATLRHVDHVDLVIHQVGAETGRQVVAAALDECHAGIREAVLEAEQSIRVHGNVIAHRGMRAAARFHAHDPALRQDPGADQKVGILAGVDIVGDGDDRVVAAEPLAQAQQQVALSRTHWPANPEADWRVTVCESVGGHGSLLNKV